MDLLLGGLGRRGEYEENAWKLYEYRNRLMHACALSRADVKNMVFKPARWFLEELEELGSRVDARAQDDPVRKNTRSLRPLVEPAKR